MKPNIDGFYNEVEHDWKELYNAFKNVFPLVDMEFIDFCRWLKKEVEA